MLARLLVEGEGVQPPPGQLGSWVGTWVRGVGAGITHRWVRERSPRRAFLEMEPILLSSMKLRRERGC